MPKLIVLLSCASLLGMVLIDRALGPRAEFLNAWSVIERLLGRAPSAGDSFIARRIGALGELLIVLLANTAIGALVATAFRVVAKMLK